MTESLLENDVASFYEYALYKSPFASRFIQNFFGKAGDVASFGGAFNVVYGSLVYDQINRESNAHAILKKENWENSGFRLTTTDPSTKSYGGAATTTAIGSVIDIAPTEIDSFPGYIHSPWNMSIDLGFRSSHDDGLDLWDWLRAIHRDNHAVALNQELLRSAQAEALAINTTTTDAKNGGNGKGIECLDRAISSTDEQAAFRQNSGTGQYDIYQTQMDRDTDSAKAYDSVVVRPDGSKTSYSTNIPFQMAGIDRLIDDTEDNLADPTAQVFLTGRQSKRLMYDEVGTQGRFDLTEAQAKLDMQGLSLSATHDGRDITYTVKTYQGRPIVSDRAVPSNGTAATFTPANGGTGHAHWFLIDQRHMHIKVGIPTLYIEVDNPVVLNSMSSKALYLTAEQLYNTHPRVHGKMRSIS